MYMKKVHVIQVIEFYSGNCVYMQLLDKSPVFNLLVGHCPHTVNIIVTEVINTWSPDILVSQ